MFQRTYQKLQTREGITFVASLALIALIFTMLFGGWGHHGRKGYGDIDNIATITVTGNGEAVASPDIAKFTFTVSQDAKTMNEAQKLASDQGNALVQELQDAGIDKKDIKTEGFNAYPKYENQSRTSGIYYGGNPVIVGYTVSTTYSVKVRNLDKAGDIATLITSSNVSSVNGPDFTFDDPNKISNNARNKAIADAKVQAEILARQLGVRLVKIIDFQVVGGGNVPYPMAYSAKAMDSAMELAPAPDILPGESDVQVQVNITYEIR